MFDYCYFDYYGNSRKEKNEPKVVSEVELWLDDHEMPKNKIGTVYSEERTWNNFMVSEYSSSDGTTLKNIELSDGRRVSEFCDCVADIYECNVFDNQGTLLAKEKYDRNGNYERSERMPDGTMSTSSGKTVFIRCMDGRML